MRNNLDRLGVSPETQDSNPPASVPGLNYIAPTEHVALPSRGKFYPSHHPLHNKETIEIKQMTAKEEDILNSKNLLKKGMALDKLLQSLLVDKAINSDSLTIEDRSAIIVAARMAAYGSEYATSVVCPSCNTKSKHSFDLFEKLESSEKNVSPEVDENGLFTVTLPATKWVVKCRALNGYDEKELARLTETKKNLPSGDSTLSDQIKMAVVSINNVTDEAMIHSAIDNMPAKDTKHLRTVYSQSIKGIDMRHSFSCNSCDFSGELEVPLTADFFWFK